jgi:uncharacterized protein
VHIAGEVTPIKDSRLKAKALSALMQKMQPEGGFEPIDPGNPIYTKTLEMTGVYRLRGETVSLKVKAGQNLTAARFDALSARLHERGGNTDGATVDIMKRFYPHENQ